MNRDLARHQLAALVQARAQLIGDQLRPGEEVLDSGEVNELALNSPRDLGSGEAILFITDQRLILHRRGNSECWDNGAIREFRLRRAPRGVPRRRWFREMTFTPAGGDERTIIGGRMFMAEVRGALGRR